VQDSGIVWGLGSDATAVTTRILLQLSFAVTGRMLGGCRVNRQSVSREQALIAHTRSNALFVFQESNLGSIRARQVRRPAGARPRLLHRAAAQIKDIRPALTDGRREDRLPVQVAQAAARIDTRSFSTIVRAPPSSRCRGALRRWSRR